MSKAKIVCLVNVAHKVHSDNSVSLELLGENSAGTRVVFELPHLETWMAVLIAENVIDGIKEVRNRVDRDLALLRQDLE